jgi:nicotinamide-nucleotide amidase
MSLAAEVLNAARAQGAMIATAESCTGGLIIGALTEIAGSSDVVDRGFVTYSNAAKMQMLGIKPDTLRDFGAVSEQIAAEMAMGALERSQAQFTIAVTGIAGRGAGLAGRDGGIRRDWPGQCARGNRGSCTADAAVGAEGLKG